MVVATRPTSCRTLVSRSGVPFFPWKYLEATIFVAVMDQFLGVSTSFCSKITSPDSLVIAAVRYSHSIASYGEIPSRVKYRRNSRPLRVGVGLPFSPALMSRISSFMRVLLPYIVLFRNEYARYRACGTDQVPSSQAMKKGQKTPKFARRARNFAPISCAFVSFLFLPLVDETFFNGVT